MADTWHTLYFRTDDTPAVIVALVDALQQSGYQRYDPFAGGTGTPPGLQTLIRHFVAPAQDGWVRVLGTPDPDLLPSLSAGFPMLHAWLTDTDSGLEVYSNGALDEQGLNVYLLPGNTIEQLARAQQGSRPSLVDRTEERLPDLLPDSVQQMARDYNVKPEQASKLMDRLTGQLFGKLDRKSDGEASTMQTQARALLAGTGQINWNSPAAQKLKGLASVLALPANWRDPDFDMLRDAYQVARRLRKSPNAQLMPDEQSALKAVPQAIAYEAIYVGK
ncbi:MAG: hypothetical protein ABI947_04835 [Chloroflexota bacterium]